MRRGGKEGHGFDHALLIPAQRTVGKWRTCAVQSKLCRGSAATYPRLLPDWMRAAAYHFRALPTSVNTVLTFVPTVWTAVMIKTAISDAMRAYSIAVAPESLSTKIFIDLNTELLLFQTPTGGQLGFLLPA
jgi:hypothetical protein